MATPCPRRPVNKGAVIKQRIQPQNIAWASFPLEIRQSIVGHYLDSCFKENGYDFSWPPVIKFHEAEAAQLALLIRLGYSFGQQDVLHPLRERRDLMHGRKEIVLAKTDEIIKQAEGGSANCMQSRIFLVEWMESRLWVVDKIIDELMRQQVR